jgi:hypothetical protein
MIPLFLFVVLLIAISKMGWHPEFTFGAWTMVVILFLFQFFILGAIGSILIAGRWVQIRC